jgi:citrate lyase beta subunit
MRNKGEKPFQTTEERGKAILKTGFATLVSIIHPQHIEEVKKSFEYKPKKKRIRKSRKVSA